MSHLHSSWETLPRKPGARRQSAGTSHQSLAPWQRRGKGRGRARIHDPSAPALEPRDLTKRTPLIIYGGLVTGTYTVRVNTKPKHAYIYNPLTKKAIYTYKNVHSRYSSSYFLFGRVQIHKYKITPTNFEPPALKREKSSSEARQEELDLESKPWHG